MRVTGGFGFRDCRGRRNPEYLNKTKQTDALFTRRNGLLTSLVWFVALIFFIVPVLFTIEAAEDLVAVVGMFGFFGAVAIAMFSVFLGARGEKTRVESQSKKSGGLQSRSNTKSKTHELESGEPTPAIEYVSPSLNVESYETGDMLPVSSVVDETTKLLKKER